MIILIVHLDSKVPGVLCGVGSENIHALIAGNTSAVGVSTCHACGIAYNIENGWFECCKRQDCARGGVKTAI